MHPKCMVGADVGGSFLEREANGDVSWILGLNLFAIDFTFLAARGVGYEGVPYVS